MHPSTNRCYPPIRGRTVDSVFRFPFTGPLENIGGIKEMPVTSGVNPR